MEAKFLVNPSLKSSNPQGSVDHVRTDMLMLTAMRGLSLGPSPQAVDKRLNGKLSEKIKQKKFKGDLSENLLLKLDEDNPARNVLLVGLGEPSSFDYCGLKDVIGVGVSRAVTMGCKRLTIEIPKDRLTAGHLNLRGMAHAIKECVAEKLAQVGANKQGIFEVELLCTPQAARHLKSGFSIPRRANKKCCDETDLPKHACPAKK